VLSLELSDDNAIVVQMCKPSEKEVRWVFEVQVDDNVDAAEVDIAISQIVGDQDVAGAVTVSEVLQGLFTQLLVVEHVVGLNETLRVDWLVDLILQFRSPHFLLVFVGVALVQLEQTIYFIPLCLKLLYSPHKIIDYFFNLLVISVYSHWDVCDGILGFVFG